MFDKEIYVKCAENYGFVLTASSLSTLFFSNLETGISLQVDIKTNNFELVYCIDHSILTISTGKLSPFYEEIPRYKQFEKFYNKILEVVNKLK